ncbi:MAG: 16S rRNA (cytosine(1402)-N(4))-methyltransferase RsmH [Prevotellaceae bacterium]|jgi:16S rRNA (cytosine1402-N4)-methyltransferase|nr:16S rRNA (cytosine(1402)-N(4))-methyltransferase RsmH [Prevotellaceae bacterium]
MNEMYHIPVLLNESIDALNINPAGIYVDVTFGGGGHSREILKRLTTGKLVAFDSDSDTEVNKINDDRFIFVRNNFRFLHNFLRYNKINEVDGILADLGVSSHHFDDASRGFSFRHNAKIDMRMNKNAVFSATQLLNEYAESELKRIFRDYGELTNAYQLAKIIVEKRSKMPIKTVEDFLTAIKQVTPKKDENKFLAKVFQSLRIEVNKEIDALEQLLVHSFKSLKNKGRLVVITYHSVEDRLVKNFMRSGNTDGTIKKDFYGNTDCPFKLITRKPIVPNDAEIEKNSRARSAKLRIAEKMK